MTSNIQVATGIDTNTAQGQPRSVPPDGGGGNSRGRGTWRGRGNGRGQWRGSMRGGGRRGRNNAGNQGNAPDDANSEQPNALQRRPQRPRPTHFLALPLHTHTELRSRISAFQTALFEGTNDTDAVDNPGPSAKGKKKAKAKVSRLVEGLDTSIVIDPRRLHMTLGVMFLEPEEPTEGAPPLVSSLSASTLQYDRTTVFSPSVTETTIIETSTEITMRDIRPSQNAEPPAPRKTISTALALLQSLKPRISEIMNGTKGVKVPLEVMDVLKTQRMRPPRARGGEMEMNVSSSRIDLNDTGKGKDREVVMEKFEDAKVGAGVLFLGPAARVAGGEDDEQKRLKQVCDLVYQTFKDAGYLTDPRPLKLHCTILNASHRKPPRRIPFSYSDILSSSACGLLGAIPPALSSGTASISTAEVNEPEAASESSSSDNDVRMQLIEEKEVEEIVLLRRTDSTTISVSESLVTTAASLPLPLQGMDDLEAPLALPSTTKNKKEKQQQQYRPPVQVPPPVPVSLGAYDVGEVQLWAMGSHGPNNEYINCGGVVLE